jgi:hypothetical protein
MFRAPSCCQLHSAHQRLFFVSPGTPQLGCFALHPRKGDGRCHIPLHLPTSRSPSNLLGLVMSACLCLNRGTVTSTENGTGSWPITLSMMSPIPSNLFFVCSAMFHVTVNTSSLHYLLADISSLSHINTFLICWPISYAFIDYRPGASATIFLFQHRTQTFLCFSPLPTPPSCATHPLLLQIIAACT